MLPLVLQ
jgi:hypothetical protein